VGYKDDGCPFCAVVEGARKTPVVYESSKVMALFPLNPAACGHTLLIPKRHVPDLWALDQADAPQLAEAVLKVAKAIRQGLRPDGLNIITSVGTAASQTVLHLHIHLVPRWHGDQFGEIWPRPSPAFPQEKISAAARSIHAALHEAADD
jgi:histidine triad (HIT) family protein